MSIRSNVTEVKIFPPRTGSKVLATGSFTLNNWITISFMVFNGKNGLFAGLPSHKNGDKFVNDVWCPNKEDRNELNTIIIEAYNSMQKNKPTQTPDKKDIPF